MDLGGGPVVFPHAATDSAFVMFTKQHMFVCGRGCYIIILSLCVNVERRLGLLNLGKECRLVRMNNTVYNNAVVGIHTNNAGTLITI